MGIERNTHNFSRIKRLVEPKQGNIMYTALSFLFICALFYTVNLQMYQASRRNLLNIDQGYQAQILAVLATEYYQQQLAAKQMLQPQQPQSRIESAPQQQTPSSSAAANADSAVQPSEAATLTSQTDTGQSAHSAPATSVTYTFNTGEVTIDTTQVPHQVVVQLADDQARYAFDY